MPFVETGAQVLTQDGNRFLRQDEVSASNLYNCKHAFPQRRGGALHPVNVAGTRREQKRAVVAAVVQPHVLRQEQSTRNVSETRPVQQAAHR